MQSRIAYCVVMIEMLFQRVCCGFWTIPEMVASALHERVFSPGPCRRTYLPKTDLRRACTSTLRYVLLHVLHFTCLVTRFSALFLFFCFFAVFFFFLANVRSASAEVINWSISEPLDPSESFASTWTTRQERKRKWQIISNAVCLGVDGQAQPKRVPATDQKSFC